MRRQDLVNLWIGEINTQTIQRRKITILQNFGAFISRTRNVDFPTPIHCISNSPSCQPYSVECESRGRAILQKSGYPRLLIDTFKDDSVHNFTGYSSLIWKVDDIYLPHDSVSEVRKNARQLLNDLKLYQTVSRFNEVGLSSNISLVKYPGSKLLVVRGSPVLKVEVKVLSVAFLDWTTPEVTVTTTQIE